MTAGGNYLPKPKRIEWAARFLHGRGSTALEWTKIAAEECGTHSNIEKKKSDECNTKDVEAITYSDLKVIDIITQENMEEEKHKDKEEEDQVDRNKGDETGRAAQPHG